MIEPGIESRAPSPPLTSEAPAAAETAATAALEAGEDVVVTAVNSNPHYLWMVEDWLRFWNLSSSCSGRPVTPVVIAVDVSAVELPAHTHGNVIWLDLVEGNSGEGHSTALASQLVRVIWPGTLPDLPGNVITSDVDMFPLSQRPFVVARELGGSDDRFVVVRNVLEEESQFPICYNLAKPAVWRAIFGNSGDLTLDLMKALAQVEAYDDTHGGLGWFSDQQYLYERVTAWEKRGGSVDRLGDSDIRHHRLDRTSSRVRAFLSGPIIPTGRWTDFHAYPPSLSSRLLNRWLAYWLSRARSSPGV